MVLRMCWRMTALSSAWNSKASVGKRLDQYLKAMFLRNSDATTHNQYSHDMSSEARTALPQRGIHIVMRADLQQLHGERRRLHILKDAI